MSEISEKLNALETELEPLVRDFRRVGEILKEIRDERLYRESYGSFEEYCQTRWHFSRQRAQQFIDAYKVDAEVGGVLENESQARCLLQVKNPDDRLTVVDKARELSDAKGEKSYAEALKACVEDVRKKKDGDNEAARVKKLQKLFCELSLDAQIAFLQWANGNNKAGQAEVIDTKIVKDDDDSTKMQETADGEVEEDPRQTKTDSVDDTVSASVVTPEEVDNG